MYKWVQEPGVVARFMAGEGQNSFQPLWFERGAEIIGRQGCVSGK